MILVVSLVFLGIVDVWCYARAPYPQRASHWWSYFPGSGFCALFIHYRGPTRAEVIQRGREIAIRMYQEYLKNDNR